MDSYLANIVVFDFFTSISKADFRCLNPVIFLFDLELVFVFLVFFVGKYFVINGIFELDSDFWIGF